MEDERVAKTIELLKITCRAYFGTEADCHGSMTENNAGQPMIQIKLIPVSRAKVRYMVGREGATAKAISQLINAWGLMQGYPRISVYVDSQ